MQTQRALFGSVILLLALGVVAFFVLSAVGGPGRFAIWLLLGWLVVLSGLVLVLDRRLR
jgi:hypothetical protein